LAVAAGVPSRYRELEAKKKISFVAPSREESSLAFGDA